MSEDPLDALQQVLDRIDEGVGAVKGTCGGWLKRATKEDLVHWIGGALRERVAHAKDRVTEALLFQGLEIRQENKKCTHATDATT